jgi:hypothetical protein
MPVASYLEFAGNGNVLHHGAPEISPKRIAELASHGGSLKRRSARTQ